MNVENVVKKLNEAYELDPVAMEALLSFKVPINQQLALHGSIKCVPVADGYTIGLLGLLNSFAPDPDRLIASCWSNEEDEYGNRQFLGFAVVKPEYADEL